MKRKDALLAIRIAGYHDDKRAFMRLYTEHRISLAVAQEEYDRGASMKAAGVGCSCYECKAKAAPVQTYRTKCGRARATYHPEWYAARPWVTYIDGTAGQHFATPMAAAEYFRTRGMELVLEPKEEGRA